jgi:hypothetical protein
MRKRTPASAEPEEAGQACAPNRLLSWTPWVPLDGCWREGLIPQETGLYRIRQVGQTDLDYIGQTGMTLGKRLAMLSGVYRPVMPYRDPHTAGPALWALRHATGCCFEVSVAR